MVEYTSVLWKSKNHIREAIGILSKSLFSKNLLSQAFRCLCPIIYYHYIGDNVSFYSDFWKGYTIEHFEDDIKTLRNFFNFVSLTEILEKNMSADAFNMPMLSITFDDGFDLFSLGIVDILNFYNIKATVFLITSCINNRNLMWRNKLCAIKAKKAEQIFMANYNVLASKFKLGTIHNSSEFIHASDQWPYRLKEVLVDELWKLCDMPDLNEYLEENKPYLTDDQLEIWVNNGHQVGLHTRTHPFCDTLDEKDIDYEIRMPAYELCNRFGYSMIAFSYPFGVRLDPNIERQLYQDEIISCALGIEGFSKKDTMPYRLERAGCENGILYPVFGKTLINSVIGR